MAAYGGSGYKKGYPIPYRSKLQQPIEPGETLTIIGQVDDEPQKPITISLKDERGQEPFHMSFRFDEDVVVMNTLNFANIIESIEEEESATGWGDEIRKAIPFKKGGPFDLRIRAHPDEFEIDALGRTIQHYHYQLPIISVSRLEVDGALTLSRVSWGGKYYSIPYSAALKLPPGHQLTITGTPERKAKEFQFSLLHSDGDNVALRLRVDLKEKKVCRNSYQEGKWQNEEKCGGDFPFKNDVLFDVILIDTPYRIEIWVNNEQYASFAHRMDPKGINGLRIEGDVEISGLGVSAVSE